MTRRLILMASAALLFGGSAHADICSSLQQQYVAAGGGAASAIGGNVASLNRALQAAQAAAQANRCYGGFFGGFFGGPGPSPSCPALVGEVNRLQNDVRQAYSNGSRVGTVMTFASVSRDQIRNALVANGCALQGSSGGYQTLCVRACDGYYFPIEYAVSRNRFQANAQTCQAMYGGAGAQLFVMPSDGDIADATPVSGGKPYGSQPYAFAYRQNFNPSCAAQLQDTVAAVATEPTRAGTASPSTAAAATAPKTPLPIPQRRPVPSEDPETLANALGNITPRSLAVAAAPTLSPSGIRVVGAGYYNLILQQQRLAGTPQTATP
jgi:hypothetical protein